jgi:hypothetical protein
MGKGVISFGAFIGSIVGGYAPCMLFHASAFSAVSIVGGFVGALAGIYGGYRVVQWIEE